MSVTSLALNTTGLSLLNEAYTLRLPPCCLMNTTSHAVLLPTTYSVPSMSSVPSPNSATFVETIDSPPSPSVTLSFTVRVCVPLKPSATGSNTTLAPLVSNGPLLSRSHWNVSGSSTPAGSNADHAER